MNEIFASGGAWVGKGIRSIETGLFGLFENAKHRIVGTAYSITPAAFDVPPTLIAAAIDRQVHVTFVINRVSSQNNRAIIDLLKLSRGAPELLELYDFDLGEEADLHAKVIVADEEIAMIGSPNYSARGLLHNYEMAVSVRGKAAATMANMILKITGPQYSRRLL
ncbi:MAG: hypothetical protein E5W81_01800 [Mesorhizobium sp.]|nr:MAG: hypothetical protein E5V36_01745 [Mesorhizobium sp.]TKC00072.1 MAG: hypothetical protein E5W81_01800 [Mesorhizobium sp.]